MARSADGEARTVEEVCGLFGTCIPDSRRQGLEGHKSQLISGGEEKGLECLHEVAPWTNVYYPSTWTSTNKVNFGDP
jgi:hypothetical protein